MKINLPYHINGEEFSSHFSVSSFAANFQGFCRHIFFFVSLTDNTVSAYKLEFQDKPQSPQTAPCGCKTWANLR